MIEFEFFDNLLDFIKELHELLKEDWKKFKIFIRENKTYVIWYIIAFITLQFTDVMSLGTSWTNYCKKNNIQIGGGDSVPDAVTVKERIAEIEARAKPKPAPSLESGPRRAKIPPHIPPKNAAVAPPVPPRKSTEVAAAAVTPTLAPKPAAELPGTQKKRIPTATPESIEAAKAAKKEKKAAKKAAAAPPPVNRTSKPVSAAPAATPPAATPPAAPPKPLTAEEQKKADKRKAIDKKKDSIKAKKAEKSGSEDSVKDVEKNLNLFQKLKGKLKDSAGQHGMAGPVLGNLDGVFGAVGGMFTFAAVILAIIGILSLPVLIFLIITYCVLKKLVGHFALY